MYRKSGCIVKKKGFYKEKLKCYIENEVFYRIKYYYVSKISGCIIKKDRFCKERLKFYIKTRFSIKKIGLCIENPVVQLKKHRFYKERLKFYIQTRFSIKNSIMYRKSGCIVKKHRFYKEKLKCYIENEVFYRIKYYYVSKTSGCIIKKDRFCNERLKFYIKTRFSIKKIVLCIENPVVQLKNAVFTRKN